MKITAAEIEQRHFEKSLRGYNTDEVNRFLANLAAEWDRLTSESKMLKMQLEIAEKEASKLREVENTLIKTLRTAEEASSKIAENARIEAENKIQEASRKAQQITADAENAAKNLLDEANQKSVSIQSTAKAEFEAFESNFTAIEQGKLDLLKQLKFISEEAAKLANSPLPDINIKPKAVIMTEVVMVPPAEITESIKEEPIALPSSANELKLEPEETEDDLEIVEGIGPKIREILNRARIKTFRQLATTPIYKLKEILESAGPHFSAHDPSTWVEQALLAEAGEWEKLNSLKDYLQGGRTPKEVKESLLDTKKPESSTNQESNSSNTEEMINKVNKVKEAIRNNMINKKDTSTENQGSFFDNLNL